METSTRDFHAYLQRSLRRDNDRHGEHSATVNALQNQSVKFLRLLPAAATSKQFDAVVSRFHDFDAARGGERAQPERLQELAVDVPLAFHRVARKQLVEHRRWSADKSLPSAAAPLASDMERAAANSSEADHPAEAGGPTA
ncbi:hypothetical protein [Bradyrhizobium yuanmingense]|uniref:hypothetical protein n=1 Tax=Bradyrhizobium yuanmingense TaxID=108015 RepID=UPI0023B9DF21|nr:hypothetical protein [Bradyrhizobium yuanmingense]MDF0578852.1 hypothetical protein [Bradyrhizobium yuanmingense]